MVQLYDDETDPYAVSCTSKTHCDSLVEYYDGSDYSAIETWNGSTWAVTEKSLPVAGSDETELSGLRCFSSTSCIAVGGSVRRQVGSGRRGLEGQDMDCPHPLPAERDGDLCLVRHQLHVDHVVLRRRMGLPERSGRQRGDGNGAEGNDLEHEVPLLELR